MYVLSVRSYGRLFLVEFQNESMWVFEYKLVCVFRMNEAKFDFIGTVERLTVSETY